MNTGACLPDSVGVPWPWEVSVGAHTQMHAYTGPTLDGNHGAHSTPQGSGGRAQLQAVCHPPRPPVSSHGAANPCVCFPLGCSLAGPAALPEGSQHAGHAAVRLPRRPLTCRALGARPHSPRGHSGLGQEAQRLCPRPCPGPTVLLSGWQVRGTPGTRGMRTLTSLQASRSAGTRPSPRESVPPPKGRLPVDSPGPLTRAPSPASGARVSLGPAEARPEHSGRPVPRDCALPGPARRGLGASPFPHARGLGAEPPRPRLPWLAVSTRRPGVGGAGRAPGPRSPCNRAARRGSERGAHLTCGHDLPNSGSSASSAFASPCTSCTRLYPPGPQARPGRLHGEREGVGKGWGVGVVL